MQYAHARICSILRNAKAEGIAAEDTKPEYLSRLTAPEERELILFLSSLTGEIVNAARSYDPARITHYITELATRFHKFYAACRVVGEDKELTLARLSLANATRIAVKNVLSMLKIEAPEKM